MTTLSTPTLSTLNPDLFSAVPHLDVLSRLLLLQNANSRIAIAHTKSRSARAGSTRKLGKQKGAGRSRKGSNRSPSRKGGGVAFGPRSNANFTLSMNAGERRLGLASALSLKAAANQIRVINTITPKTADMVKALHDVTSVGSVLFVITPEEKTKNTGIKNIAHSHVDVVTHLSPAEILKYDFCVFTASALETLSTHFSS